MQQIFVTHAAFSGNSSEYHKHLLSEISAYAHYLTSVRCLPQKFVPSYALATKSLEINIGQVLNGGHSQFIADMGTNAKRTLDDVIYLFSGWPKSRNMKRSPNKLKNGSSTIQSKLPSKLVSQVPQHRN